MKDFAKSIVCNTKAEAAKVGNAYQYAGSIPIEKIPDNWRPEFPKAGYVVYYAPNKAKWFATEAEAKKFAESQDKAQKTGNSKVGNEAKVNPVDPSQKPGSKPNPDNNQNPKKNQKEEITDKNGRTFREVLEEVKKTGNKYNIKPMSYKADAYRYGKELAEQDFKNFKYSNTSTLESIYRNNTSGEDYEQYGFSDFKKGYYDTYQQMDKKVGNSTEKLFYGLSKDAEKEEEKSDEALDELKKTGNTKVKKTLFKSLSTPTTWTPGINGRPIAGAPEFKGTFAKDEAEKWTDKWIKDHGFEVENKVGNASSEYEILKQDPSKMHPMYKKAYEEAMKKLAREDEEFKKRFEKEYGVKAKNEASDDKFAYVMREFDEGKLKTPDGKVVTDPAQAKAIAYSESKKTENGLARARNAIKKNS